MKHDRDSGHAVLITVTIILAVVVLGLLGWVFWRNFLNKPAATTTASTATTSKITTADSDLTQSTTATYGGQTLTIKYPASWQDVKDGTVGSGITSPDGNIIIRYTMDPKDGFGGTDCSDPSTPVFDPVTYATWEAIPGNSDVIFASYIWHNIKTPDQPNATDFYYYGFAAMKNEDAIKNVKTGDSGCVFHLVDEITLPGISGALLQVHAIFKSLYLNLNSLTAQRIDTTQKDIQDTLTSADAQTAQKIIESLTIK